MSQIAAALRQLGGCVYIFWAYGCNELELASVFCHSGYMHQLEENSAPARIEILWVRVRARQVSCSEKSPR